jgi:methyl-accepting chemotaxis protein
MSIGLGREAKSIVPALDKSFATIKFDMQENILTANASFCSLAGYALNEIRGRHESTGKARWQARYVLS